MMMPSMAGARAYTDEEVDAAVHALTDPERLRGAQELVARIAPQLQRVLGEALDAGGWFSSAHDSGVRGAAAVEDAGERERAVRTLVAEETRLGMLVGVAVGYELARQLPTSED
jgi:anti-sigma factor RsiW